MSTLPARALTHERDFPTRGTYNAVITVTVIVVLQSMRGRKVVVEMKNDVEISGILEETDASMK